MFNELTKQIELLLSKKSPVVVAITGFAGSGKSTLASWLAEHFHVQDCQILRLDNMYMPIPRGGGLFDDYDWTLVRQILSSAHFSERLRYTTRGFEGERHQIDEPMPKVVIIEGIRLFREELMNYFDLSVYVNCPPEIALQRAKARDISQGHDEAYMRRWDTEWGPFNQRYFDEYRPDQLADFLYREFK